MSPTQNVNPKLEGWTLTTGRISGGETHHQNLPVSEVLAFLGRIPPEISNAYVSLGKSPEVAICQNYCLATVLEEGHLKRDVDMSFRLQFWGCPLRKYLAGFRLHYHLEMADALTVAYFLLKRGANPIDALTADYSLIPRGLLRWVDIDRVKSNDATKEDRKIWWPFRSFYEQGDRLIEYNYPGNRGYLLVRGDRLVWEDEAFHGNVVCPSLRFQVEDDHFLALGGTRGFLNGDFVWPDPDWVNPVTDEEEWAAGGKRHRGITIPATPGTTQCSIE